MKKSRRRSPKSVLRLPDLEHAKSAVLNSLASPESRRSYEFAIQNFVHWYCSEPRLALNRIVVTRYRMQLEQLHLVSGGGRWGHSGGTSGGQAANTRWRRVEHTENKTGFRKRIISSCADDQKTLSIWGHTTNSK
jgi:hypothetical protein